jgi:hypothetical protein
MSGSVGSVGPWGRHLENEEAAAEIECFARFGGWLETAATLPALRRAIAATQSERGINSDYTTVDLWGLVRQFPSPHFLERKLWKTMNRTRAILSAFTGEFTPEWKHLMHGLMVSRQVSKAAVVAAALKLSTREYFGKYRDARDWLVQFHAFTGRLEVNGSTVRFQEGEEGLAVKAMVPLVYKGHTQGHKEGFLVRAGVEVHTSFAMSAEKAVEEALHRWSIEGGLEAAFDLPKGMVVLSDEQVLVRQRLRARVRGANYFPDGEGNESFLASGEYISKVMEGSRYDTDPLMKKSQRRVGSDILVSRGDVIVVFAETFGGGISTLKEVKEVVVRSHVQPSEMADLVAKLFAKAF